MATVVGIGKFPIIVLDEVIPKKLPKRLLFNAFVRVYYTQDREGHPVGDKSSDPFFYNSLFHKLFRVNGGYEQTFSVVADNGSALFFWCIHRNTFCGFLFEFLFFSDTFLPPVSELRKHTNGYWINI